MAPPDDRSATQPASSTGSVVIRGTMLRVLFVLGMLLGIAIAQFALTGSHLEQLESKAALINLADRQRMLIHQATLLSKQLADAAIDPERETLLRKLSEVDQLLAEMETAVASYEGEVDASTRALRVAHIAVFLGTLSVLAVAGLGVFRPMVQRIRDETEKRDEQEKQLSLALDELRVQRDERRDRMQEMAGVLEDLQQERAALEREIQAREHVQQALQHSEQVFHAIVESAPAAMVMINPSGKIALVNAETERLFGYNRKELLGASIEILVPHRFRFEHPKYRDEFFVAPTSRPMGAGGELFGLRKDGTEVPVEIGLTPIEAEEGVFVLSAIVDITEREQAAREIRRINAELLKKNDEMQQFVYTVSHDLKSPLVTCKGFIGVAREDLKEGLLDDVESALARIEGATEKMGQLIQDLLQLSRIGAIRNEPDLIDVNDLMHSILADLSTRIDDVNAVVSIGRDIPPVVADRVRLTQAFENLLTNAIKYGCRDEHPKISIEGLAGAGEVRYCVRDNGSGIAPQFHEKIFGLFERLEHDKDGTGVGLAAVARIMEAHGGRAWVESNVGEGAAFWLAFPDASQRQGASRKR